jgi:hypothetical protein
MDGTKCKGSAEYSKDKFGYGDVSEIINPNVKVLEETYSEFYNSLEGCDCENNPGRARTALLKLAGFLRDNLHVVESKLAFVDNKIAKKMKNINAASLEPVGATQVQGQDKNVSI